jgi:hypothetical protein
VAVKCRQTERHHSASLKMAAPLVTCTKEEQRSVIRFLISEGVKPTEVHRMASFLITETQEVPDAGSHLQGRLC